LGESSSNDHVIYTLTPPVKILPERVAQTTKVRSKWNKIPVGKKRLIDELQSKIGLLVVLYCQLT
jgi:hypothetical protein